MNENQHVWAFLIRITIVACVCVLGMMGGVAWLDWLESGSDGLAR